MTARDLVSLPFDLYQRYRLVADIVEKYPSAERPLRVLDVGGRTAILREFLPDAAITLVDVDPSDAPGLILGSGCELPFADRAFDVVTACDTLEHVPAGQRDEFVAEACRVSRGWVVLAGPYRSARVVEAEELLRVFLSEKLGTRHRYLDEHEERGLPDLSATTAALEGAGAEALAIGHASLKRWLPLMCLSMYLDEDPQLRKVAKRYYRFYNETLYASDHAGPVYRHAVVGSVNGVPLPVKEELLAPPVAPPEALTAFDQLVGELVAFDREKEVYQAERDRLTAVNEGLVADLLGNREKAETLEQDLEGHREKIEEVTSLNEQQEEVIGTLERDLDAHRDVVEELREQQQSLIEGHELMVEELQGQIDQLQEVLGELNDELAAHRELVATQQDELAERVGQHVLLEEEVTRVNDVACGLNLRLVAECEENERLRAELRNRFSNLKRALGPKRTESG